MDALSTGSDSAEGTPSAPSAATSAVAVPPEGRPPVPQDMLDRWQRVLDLGAEIMQVPVAAISTFDASFLTVLVANRGPGDLLKPGDRNRRSADLYCEKVITDRNGLFVMDARKDPQWARNPVLELGLIFYVGYPIAWPDGQMFGSVCIMDRRPNEHAAAHRDLVKVFRDIVETDLRTLVEFDHRTKADTALHYLNEDLEARIRIGTVQLEEANRELREEVEIRKEAEQALEISRERYFKLFEAANDAIFLVQEGLFIDCNSCTLELFDCERGQILGHRPHEFSPPVQYDGRDSQVAAKEKIDSALEGQDVCFEWLHCRKDGTPFDAEVSLTRVDLQGWPTILAIVRDVTERKRAQEELLQTRALLQAAIEQSSAGILIADAPDVRIRLVNSAALEIRGDAQDVGFDVPVEEYGRRWETYRPDGTPYPSEELPLSLAVLHGQVSRNVEVIIRRPDGEDRWVMANAAPIRDSSGHIIAGIVVFSDITEFKRAEQESIRLREDLHRSQKLQAIGELAAGVAHDFNNLLTVITGHIDLLQHYLTFTDEARESIDAILQATQQASGVTRSLLTFSQKLPTEKKSVDLCQVIEKVRLMLQRTLPATIELIVDTRCEPAPWVEADPTQLQQIILNLAVNARDAMPDGGTLRIGVHPPVGSSRYARLVVSDTGIGMPPEIVERIFEPFFTTKTREQGTGLGLSVIHGIVKEHGGHVEVESQVGDGSTFTVFLPTISPTAEERPWVSDEIEPRGQGETILMAEDDPNVRSLLSNYLRTIGYEVLETADGEAFLEAYLDKAEAVDLIVLDLDLPKRSGKTCLRMLRDQKATAPIVVITGSIHVQCDGEIQAGTFLLRKPFQLTALSDMLRRALEQKHPE